MKTSLLRAAVAATLFATPVLAQEATWTGEGSFGAGFTTGNTETSDFGLGLKLGRQAGPWEVSLEAIAEYAETNSVETKNRTFFAGQLDRDFSERMYGFGRASWEQDEFSGFESRAFVGAGLGYRVIMGEPTTWDLEIAPGVKFDEVRAAPPLAAYSETGLGVIGASRFTHQFNENVKLTNDTVVTYADTSTQFDNRLAVTAALNGALSARFSVDVRYDTDPPLGFDDTDTATRVSLVYAFGD